jgi:thiamine-phosphate pyrophosphorylase
LPPRFYPILDTRLAAALGLPAADAAKALLDGGARWIQFRHKTAWTRETFALLEEIAALASGATLIVNDRADWAAVFDAGLHLGQQDLPPARARRLVPNAVLGYSTHTAEQLEASNAEPVSYAALGPIFRTATKENPDPEVGLDRLRDWRPITRRPLVAIGGITLDTAPQVFAAGADSIAVISCLYPPGATLAGIYHQARLWSQL